MMALQSPTILIKSIVEECFNCVKLLCNLPEHLCKTLAPNSGTKGC